MQKHIGWVTDTHGEVIPNVTITVTRTSGGATATIYSDDGTTTKTNPFTVDTTDGSYVFYALDGRYTITPSKTGYTFDTTDTSDIVLHDPREIRYNVREFGATGDGVTDDTVAINATFTAARALGRNVEIYFPGTSSYYLVTSSINAGGFANAPPTVRGTGSKNTGSRIHGAFSTAGQAIFDFSGNEGGQILDLTIEGDSTTTPAIGLLLAGATVGGSTRGGINYLQNVQVSGVYTSAAIVVRSADLCRFNFVNAGIQVPSGSSGVSLYVVNGGGVTPEFTISSAFRTLSDATGLTSFVSMNGHYALAGNLVGGATNRATWLIHGISGKVNSVNDDFIFGGVTASAIEFISSGNSLYIWGVRHESGGGSFIKTDGFKDSVIYGNVQKNGTTPLIDAKATYGTGDGIISNSTISLNPSGTSAHLFNTADSDTGLLFCDIRLNDSQDLIMSAGQTAGNVIHSPNGTTVTLNETPGTDANIEMVTATVSMRGDLKLSTNSRMVLGAARTAGPLLAADDATRLQAIGGTNGIRFLSSNLTNTLVDILDNGNVQILQNGLTLGAPTGGDKGTGTINAADSYWANGVEGVTAGPFTTISSITVTNGIITALTGS